MDPDLVLLRELLEGSPAIRVWPGDGKPEEWIRAAEADVGPLAPSYRWWLAEFGGGAIGGAPIATVGPPSRADAVDDITAGWRLREGRLCFYSEPDCGDAYHFVLDDRAGREQAVVRHDHLTGEEEPVADSFAGFLTVQAALEAGLKDGPNPTIARLWRSTPGVLLPNGVLVYGPQTIAERNDAFEIRRYAPQWVLVGDDSGGNGLLMRRHGRDRTSVYLMGLGAIGPDIEDDGERVTGDLIGWLRAGAVLP